MMEVYNVISNIPFMLIVIVLTYSMGSGLELDSRHVLNWMDRIAYTIRVQIMRYRDLEYNLPAGTLGTPTLKIVTKNIFLPQLVSVIVTQTSQLLPSFISYEAFFLLRTWSSNHSSKFGTLDF